MLNDVIYREVIRIRNVYTEINRIRKSQEANDFVDISYKKISEAAVARVVFWLKRIATMMHLKNPVVPSANETVPPRVKSALKRYICLSDDRIQDTYYLFKELIIFLYRMYRPRNPLSTTLTVECVDEAVMSVDSPLHDYIDQLLLIRSLPEVNRKCRK